jgi:glucose/arabinose dehydrogenase
MRLSGVTAALAALLSAAGTVDAQVKRLPVPASCSGVSASAFPQYTVASGWSVMKLKGGLKQVRTVVFDTAGNMLVAEATKGISVHTFGADGCINSTAMLVSNIRLNHGLDLTPDGKTMYASGENQVFSWTYDPATRTATNQKTVITGMATGIHSTRTVKVVPKSPNLLLAQVGSNSNLDMQSAQASTGRAIIKVFDISKAPASGYNYNTQGEVFAYGLRNEIGFVPDPAGNFWGVENSGDVRGAPTPFSMRLLPFPCLET